MMNPYVRLALLVSALLFASCEQDESKVPMPPKATESTPEERYNNGAGAPAEPEAAIAWYTEYAEAGVTDAYYKLGMCYYNTRSIPMNFVKAVEHFRLAAEQGHPEACAKLAECYEWGVGVETDPVEAAKWRSEITDVNQHRNIQNTPTKPAEEQPKEEAPTPPVLEKAVEEIQLSPNEEMTVKDNVNSDGKEFLEDKANEKDETAGLNAEQIRELGVDYADGSNGKEVNDQKAVQLYIQAAEMGDSTAQRWLGWRYRTGKGVDKDDQKARHYFSLAAAQGDKQAEAALNPTPVQPKKATPGKAAPKKAKQSTPSKKATKSAPKKTVRNKYAATLTVKRDQLMQRMVELELLMQESKAKTRTSREEEKKHKPHPGFDW